MKLNKSDPQIAKLIEKEKERQETCLEMIPSENHSSPAVREALGSILTDKYAEGYPGKRYYAGLEFYDKIEILCQERAKKLFGVPFVNVQPYSGSPANQAVYFAVCQPGDTITGMSLPHGGHLTHGWKVNFSAKFYNSAQYGVDEKSGLIDFEKMEQLAKEAKPKIIFCGATAYPRIFEWEKFAKIAESVGAYLVADIAHIAGLVVSGVHPSPVSFADVVTTTTHKTLRGPRGAMIMATEKGLKKDPELPQKINKAIFPGLQGGPHENNIAAIAVCLKEASSPSFKKYGKQIIKNSKALAEELLVRGFNLVTGGTDNHLILIDLRNKKISGKEAQIRLEKAGITVNKNTIPFDLNPPFEPSGIRLGTPAITTRGMKEKEMKIIAEWIDKVIVDEKSISKVRQEIKKFCRKFPLP
ncbi:MAG: serine hydroxymethyltransferase [Candidatus Nealsonbacteria bacterium RIFCSPHIGHO2_12_FULL_38_18]|nr:MAG: serine hydroxymethyltransferase [Candidatus Nealsonbacteria bacterium RIFCSPHIGHO2_12_FULL_38_18]